MKSIPPIPTHRQCKKCQEVKLLEEFCIDKKARYGREWKCIACKRRLQKAYYAEFPEKKPVERRTPEQLAAKKAHDRERYHSEIRGEKIKSVIEYRSKNPDKVREWNTAGGQRYRTKKAGNGGHFSFKDVRNMRYIQQGHCCYCGRVGFKLVIEHIIPVTQGGPSDPWNLCLACAKCNNSKGGRTLEQWVNRWYLK